MNEVPKQRWGCVQWGMVAGGIVLFFCLANPNPTGTRIQTQGKQVKAVNNCKQIILCLKQYAKDADSAYPDGRHQALASANQVFRELFKDEIITDERIFGCPESKFHPDNDLGGPPNYEKALMPGECHWMLLKHQTNTSHPKMPIIVENSLDASWPPRWDTSRPTFSWLLVTNFENRGRSWRGREIIIGRNDGTVQKENLREDGTLDWHSPPNLDEHGKSWIDYLTPEQIANLAYWDIEENVLPPK